MFQGAIDLLAQFAKTFQFQLEEHGSVAAVTVIVNVAAAKELCAPAATLITQTAQCFDGFPVIQRIIPAANQMP